MSKLIDSLINNKSAFRYMAICAIGGLIGSILGTSVDIFWLVMDMINHLRLDHFVTLLGLTVADIVMIVSTFFFYKAVFIYTTAHPKKVSEKRQTKAKISKQSAVIMKLNHRIDELEDKLNNR